MKIGQRTDFDFNHDFFFEYHFGVGLVYRKSVHAERENINDKLFFKLVAIVNKEGNRWLLNLPINLKLGYRF